MIDDFCGTMEEFKTALYLQESAYFENHPEGDGVPNPAEMLGESSEGKKNKPAPNKLLTNMERTRDAKTKNTIANIEIILEHDPAFKDKYIFDNRIREVRIVKDLLGTPTNTLESERFGRLLTDLDLQKAVSYLSRVHGIETTAPKVMHRLAVVAEKTHSINPIHEKLKETIWDGKLRLDTFLIDNMGAEDTPVHREASRLMFMGPVARALNPGSQFDTVTVLEGKQGIGKSTFVKMLAMDSLLYGAVIDPLTSTDSQMIAHNHWIIELPEGTALKNTSDADSKAVISNQIDPIRKPYETKPTPYPRQFSFIMTNNEQEYLGDYTRIGSSAARAAAPQ
jgi:predicted P-loop ATPase